MFGLFTFPTSMWMIYRIHNNSTHHWLFTKPYIISSLSLNVKTSMFIRNSAVYRVSS